jgi:glutamyl-tRNA reductase
VTVAIVQVGIDHHLAPLEVREHLALDQEMASLVARQIHSRDWADEALVLATCNRTEVYVASALPGAHERALQELLRHLPRAPAADQGCYRQQGGDAAALWMLRVAAGLESAVVGETEIQGQLRDAHARAQAQGTLGPILDRLTQSALRAGKRARAETGISAGGVSHGRAAVQVAGQVFDSLKGRQVLLVGAGAIAQQTGRALAELEGARILVANRTQSRAEVLAAQLPGATTIPLASVTERLGDVHVALFAAAKQDITVEIVAQAVARRRDPLLLVDLGLPRCVDPAVREQPGVFLYDLEDLEVLVKQALEERRRAMPEVETILREEYARYRGWYRTLSALPTLRTLNEWAESIRQEELAYAQANLPPEAHAAAARLSERLIRRLLGRAAARVVRGAEERNPEMPTAEHLRHVFGLDEGETL